MKRFPQILMRRTVTRGGCLGVLLLAVLWTGCRSLPDSRVARENRQKITYYEQVLEGHPERYPVRVLLAAACLQEARQSHDPRWILRARQQLEQSLQVQPTAEAFLVMTRVQNYAHRFEDALVWAQRAADASPEGSPGPEIRALQLEAYLGLGRTNDARTLVPFLDRPAQNFYEAASKAAWFQSQGKRPEAGAAFREAAQFARREGDDSSTAWAEVNAAGMFIDDGQPERARPHLERAAELDPGHCLLLLHWGEYYEAREEYQPAWTCYHSLSRSTHDPEVHHRAFLIARRLGRTQDEAMHFSAAEAGFRRAIDAGEIYTLGALARLYLDADVRQDEALALAEKNVQFVRDAEAVATLERARRRGAAHPGRSGVGPKTTWLMRGALL